MKLPARNVTTSFVRRLNRSVWIVSLFLPAGAAAVESHARGGHHDSPVFFEKFADAYIELYSSRQNLTLLPGGKVHIPPFEIQELGEFTWSTGSNWNLSWALRLEDFYYLLPMIQVYGDVHRKFLKNWFFEWDVLHQDYQKPNDGAWEYMTTGIRSMILVYLLKQEESRPSRDELFITNLRRSLREHQKFLLVESHFDHDSNHGMWEAIALVELDRVLPNREYKDIGLKRLLLLVGQSVSQPGIHLEHSPAYHFVFLSWLLDYIAYLTSIRDLDWDRLAELERISQTMLEASYFLQDHHGFIPVIGDSDELRVEDRFRVKETRDAGGLFFDKKSGYAVYKDRRKSRLRRYIVFNIQNKKPELPHHFHNDALAVYYNYDGEVILGDQGKYAYTGSDDRSYFTSCSAHNVMVPPSFLEPAAGLGSTAKSGGIILARDPWFRATGGRVVMGGQFRRNYRIEPQLPWKLFEKPRMDGEGGDRDDPPRKEQVAGSPIMNYTFTVNRRVTIPEREPELTVEDVVGGDSEAVLVWNIGPDVSTLERLETAGPDAGRRYEWQLVTKKRKKFKLTVEIDGKVAENEVSLLIKRGETSPIIGWYAPQFMKKVPAPVILLHLKKPSEVWVTTRLVKVR